MLLRETRPDRDAAVLAHLLLAPFVSSLLQHLRAEQGVAMDQIKAALDDLLPI
jgi:hypothetical protein